MSHGRPPRRPRRISLNLIELARNNATALSGVEIASAIDPLRAAAKALREGVATELQWSLVASAMNVAQAIEREGIVKGLGEHLRSAEFAVRAIERRALASGAWTPTALYYQELDHIATALDLHEYQLQQLSYSEFRRVAVRAEAEIRSNGGRVMDVGSLQEVLV